MRYLILITILFLIGCATLTEEQLDEYAAKDQCPPTPIVFGDYDFPAACYTDYGYGGILDKINYDTNRDWSNIRGNCEYVARDKLAWMEREGFEGMELMVVDPWKRRKNKVHVVLVYEGMTLDNGFIANYIFPSEELSHHGDVYTQKEWEDSWTSK